MCWESGVGANHKSESAITNTGSSKFGCFHMAAELRGALLRALRRAGSCRGLDIERSYTKHVSQSAHFLPPQLQGKRCYLHQEAAWCKWLAAGGSNCNRDRTRHSSIYNSFDLVLQGPC